MGDARPEIDALMLRNVRRLSGMLQHPEAEKVFVNQKALAPVLRTLNLLVSATGLTPDEVIEYGRAGAKDLVVNWSPKHGVYCFDFADDHNPAIRST